MEMLKKLSLNAQLVLLGSILYVIFSFLHWQAIGTPLGTYSRNEWNGVGIIAGLLVILLLAWEFARGFELKVGVGSLTPALVSVVLAEALLLLTVIKFFSVDFRAYGAWIGLVLSIGIGVIAFVRGKEEGAAMPAAAKSGGAAA